ncbi:MAG TPA: hypothetical protein VGG28_13880, partial [Kofleriaceae bacterium]
FTSDLFASPSGAYAYERNGYVSTCAGYIVDVYMDTDSNTNPYKGKATSGPLVAYAGAYDLPGSKVVDGQLPITQNDCTRLSEVVYEYTWPHTDVGYTYVGGILTEGTWSDGACSLATVSTYPKGATSLPILNPSSSGVDRYRFVSAVIERTTYQESMVGLAQPPPT